MVALEQNYFFRIIEALAGCYSSFTPRAVKLNYTKLTKCSHYYLLFHECCYRFQPHDFVNHPLRGVDSVHLQMQPLKSSNISNVNSNSIDNFSYYTHTHTHLTALCPGLSGWAGTRKVKQSGFYWSKRQWVAVASAGPYASLHVATDR